LRLLTRKYCRLSLLTKHSSDSSYKAADDDDEDDDDPSPPTPPFIRRQTSTETAAASDKVPGVIGASPNSFTDSLSTPPSNVSTSTMRLRDAIVAKRDEEMMEQLELTMTNYALKAFAMYKGLYGLEETIDGDFMKEFRKISKIKVSGIAAYET
jgi:hypothetical protein